MDRSISQNKEKANIANQSRTHWHCQLQRIPIAIIGMAALFPKARSLQEYWENIVGKVDCITDVPPDCWNIADYYDPNPKTPDKTYSKRGGFIPEINFDPLEFGLPPDTLEAIDSAQLLSLMVAKAALEDAGYGKSREFNRETTGVVLGASGLWKTITPLTSRLQYPLWEKVLKSSGLSDGDTQKIIEKLKLAFVPWEENSFPGMLTNVVAGRITNRLDLGGTNCTVDAACASSLSAFKMAVGELIERRCDLMITGGFDTDNSILNYMCFSKTPALSKKDFLNPFDADSDGMMVGEGIGMLVLKRLDDAERDGDRIYAVIKGVGTASDGRYKSIYAPRPEGQARALRRAYEDAGFSPTTVGLMEAHGTGTPAGDLCEFTALNEVFSENNPTKQHIALGSVKSQIGHTKAAAGAASLIKAALALHHKTLPPTINVTQPNPKFKIETSPFYVNTEVKPWIREGDTPRRAGVSSFGFGGTNYHVVLEEYGSEQSCAYRLHTVPQSILLCADNPEQLLAQCKAVLEQLESDAGNQRYTELINSCKSLVVPITAARVGFIAVSLVEACELLHISITLLQNQGQATFWSHPRGIYYRKMGIPLQGKVVALFPGQGAQYLEMGRKLAVNFPPLHQAYSSLDDLFIQDGLQPLSKVVFPCPAFDSNQKATQTEALQQTENAQPAIGAFSVGLYKILQQAGFKPDFVAGHSFGELTALWAAEVLSDKDYFYLVKARGKAMSTPHNGADCDAGTMLAVHGDIRNIQEIIRGLSRLSIANFNSPNQVVLSGSKPEIATVQQILEQRGYSVTPLPVSAAFHTRFVSHACEPFANAVRAVTFNNPQTPVYSNTTGEPYPSDPETIQKTLEAHLLKPVQFEQEIESIYSAGGYCFIEFGPRQILTNLVKSILGHRPHIALALNGSREKDSDRQLRQAVIQLRVAGLPLHNLDPYQLEPIPPEVGKGKLNVRLSGSNYISEKTKAAFEKALQDGHQIQRSVDTPETAPAEIIPLEIKTITPEAIPTAIATISADVIPEPRSFNTDVIPPAIATTTEPDYTPANTTDLAPILSIIEPEEMLQSISQSPSNDQHFLGSSLEKLLTQFGNHQSEILRVHEQYLKNQAECSQAFFQLMQQQFVMLAGSNTTPGWVELAPAATVTTQQTPLDMPSTAIAEPRLGSGNEVTNTLTTVSVTTPAATKAPDLTVAMPAPASINTEGKVITSQLLMQVISNKTGYPLEMLEREMNPRSDLGIDTVKWVEIVEAMQELLPELPKINASELAEQHTITGVAEYIHCILQPTSSQTLTPATSSDVAAPVATPIELTPIAQSLLDVVGEKTGYPAEMLDMNMDLEADLGIDSIKRVEIIGAMQELFPDLPNLSPEELGEQRTLHQIADYLATKISGAEKKTL